MFYPNKKKIRSNFIFFLKLSVVGTKPEHVVRWLLEVGTKYYWLYLIVDCFRPKIDVFILVLGPNKHDNDDGGSDDSEAIATHFHVDKSSFELFRAPHGRNADIVGKFGPTSKEGSLEVAKALGMTPNATWALSPVRLRVRMDESVSPTGELSCCIHPTWGPQFGCRSDEN